MKQRVYPWYANELRWKIFWSLLLRELTNLTGTFRTVGSRKRGNSILGQNSTSHLRKSMTQWWVRARTPKPDQWRQLRYRVMRQNRISTLATPHRSKSTSKVGKFLEQQAPENRTPQFVCAPRVYPLPSCPRRNTYSCIPFFRFCYVTNSLLIRTDNRPIVLRNLTITWM